MIHPRPVVLEGNGIRLEPLESSHLDALRAAAADGELWNLWYVSTAELAPDRGSSYVDIALRGQHDGHMLPWVVRESTSGEIIGSSRYCEMVPAIDRVEIGYTFYAERWQRTHVNTGCKLLLLAHAFDTLGCSVVGFRVDNLNVKSQTAMQALGATRDGIIRRFQPRADGSARDTYIYSILDSEWPDVRRHLERRLQRHARRGV